MTFCLDTEVIPPNNDEPIKNVIILLHGYGGDGKDISMLTLNWKRFLKNTLFLCPNGHEKCEINPMGFLPEYLAPKVIWIYPTAPQPSQWNRPLWN